MFPSKIKRKGEGQNEKLRFISVSLAAILSIFLAVGVASAQAISSQPVYYAKFMDTVSQVEELSTFVEVVKAAGLEETLNKGEYTIFAPQMMPLTLFQKENWKDCSSREQRNFKRYTHLSRNSSSSLSRRFSSRGKVQTLNGHLIHVF